MAQQQGFIPFPKIARLNRDIIITEKIDGTNAAVRIIDANDVSPEAFAHTPDADPIANVGGLYFFAQSRSRLIEPGDDNFGFAAWVVEHADDLACLGPGTHFGEWWGRGIQRGYALVGRRFSLFNVSRWGDGAVRPLCCDVVPTLYSGLFSDAAVEHAIHDLRKFGSVAARGFFDAEGVVIFHTASSALYKVTLIDDEKPKGQA